jgi:putative aminopeptidase FrvX
MDKRIVSVALSLLALFLAAGLDAEESSLSRLAETLFIVPSPTGYEWRMAEIIEGNLPAGYITRQDNMGSLYAGTEKKGSRLAVCTPMDEAGYFVSGINPDGYLRLDKPVSGPDLIDSYHLGHPMMVWTERGPVEGVLALPSLHILSPEMRRELEAGPGLEFAYLDIGASSESEAREKDVSMLDAVTPWRELARLAGGKLAGYSLGLKYCAALVLDLAKNRSPSQNPDLTFVWMAQTKFPLRRSRPRSALGALCASRELESESNVIVVDIFPCDAESERKITIGNGPVLAYSGKKGARIGEKARILAQKNGFPLQIVPDYGSSVMNPFMPTHEEVIGLLLPVKFSDTPAETIDTRDADILRSLLLALLDEGRQR